MKKICSDIWSMSIAPYACPNIFVQHIHTLHHIKTCTMGKGSINIKCAAKDLGIITLRYLDPIGMKHPLLLIIVLLHVYRQIHYWWNAIHCYYRYHSYESQHKYIFFSHKKYMNLQQKYSMIRQEADLMLVYCDTRLLILDSTLVVIGI